MNVLTILRISILKSVLCFHTTEVIIKQLMTESNEGVKAILGYYDG